MLRLPYSSSCQAQSKNGKLFSLVPSLVNLIVHWVDVFWEGLFFLGFYWTQSVIHEPKSVTWCFSFEGGQGFIVYFFHVEAGHNGWHWWDPSRTMLLFVEALIVFVFLFFFLWVSSILNVANGILLPSVWMGCCFTTKLFTQGQILALFTLWHKISSHLYWHSFHAKTCWS